MTDAAGNDQAGPPSPPNPTPRPPGVVRTAHRLLWRHRWISALLLLVLSTLAIRLIWGRSVEHRLQPYRAAVAAQGWPIDGYGWKVEPISGDRNAVKLISQANALYDLSSPYDSSTVYPNYFPMGAEWQRLAAASDRSNAKVFDLIRLMRSMNTAQFQGDLHTPLHAYVIAKLGSVNSIPRGMMIDGIRYRHVVCDDVEAIERIRDLLHAARLFHQGFEVVQQLSALGHAAPATQSVLLLAPELRLNEPEVRRATEALIADLLDERGIIEGFDRAGHFDRCAAIDFARSRNNGAWLLQPIAGEAELVAFQNGRLWADAIRAPDAVAADRITAGFVVDMPYTHRAASAALAWGGPVVLNQRPYHDWLAAPRAVVNLLFASLAERRMAAVSLAAQCYRQDHGRYPSALQELVPKYLPAVPADPGAEGAPPLGYVVQPRALPDGRDRPLVFSRQGAPHPQAIDVEPMYDTVLPPGVRDRWSAWQYRDLTRWTPNLRRYDVQRAAEEQAARQEAKAREEFERWLRGGDLPPVPHITPPTTLPSPPEIDGQHHVPDPPRQ